MSERMSLQISTKYRSSLKVTCARLDMRIKDFVEQAIQEKLSRIHEDEKPKQEQKSYGLWEKIKAFFK